MALESEACPTSCSVWLWLLVTEWSALSFQKPFISLPPLLEKIVTSTFYSPPPHSFYTDWEPSYWLPGWATYKSLSGSLLVADLSCAPHRSVWGQNRELALGGFWGVRWWGVISHWSMAWPLGASDGLSLRRESFAPSYPCKVSDKMTPLENDCLLPFIKILRHTGTAFHVSCCLPRLPLS